MAPGSKLCCLLVPVLFLCLTGTTNADAFQTGGAGNDALFKAAASGDVARIKILIHKGENVNARYGKPQQTPLMVASRLGQTEVVRILLSNGANPNLKLVAKYNNFTALMFASTSGHADIVKLLLGRGAKVNAKLSDGKTALMLASMWGYTEAARTLLTGGARWNIKDKDGKTALKYAEEGKTPSLCKLPKGHLSTIRLLKNAGATY